MITSVVALLNDLARLDLDLPDTARDGRGHGNAILGKLGGFGPGQVVDRGRFAQARGAPALALGVEGITLPAAERLDGVALGVEESEIFAEVEVRFLDAQGWRP